MDLQLQRVRAHRSGVEAGGQEQLRAGSVWKPLGLQWNWSDRRHRPQPGLLLRPAGQRRNPRPFPYSCPILGCLAPQVVKKVGESRECDPEKSRNKTRGSVSQSTLGSPLSRGLPGKHVLSPGGNHRNCFLMDELCCILSTNAFSYWVEAHTQCDPELALLKGKDFSSIA